MSLFKFEHVYGVESNPLIPVLTRGTNWVSQLSGDGDCDTVHVFQNSGPRTRQLVLIGGTGPNPSWTMTMVNLNTGKVATRVIAGDRIDIHALNAAVIDLDTEVTATADAPALSL